MLSPWPHLKGVMVMKLWIICRLWNVHQTLNQFLHRSWTNASNLSASSLLARSCPSYWPNCIAKAKNLHTFHEIPGVWIHSVLYPLYPSTSPTPVGPSAARSLLWQWDTTVSRRGSWGRLVMVTWLESGFIAPRHFWVVGFVRVYVYIICTFMFIFYLIWW